MRVTKWGDDLAVRLPREIVESLRLKEGDEVQVVPKRYTGTAQTPEEREAALRRLRSLRGMMPADFKFDRDEANER